MSKIIHSKVERKQIVIKPIEVLTKQGFEDDLPDVETNIQEKENEWLNLLNKIKQAEESLVATQNKIKNERKNWENEKKLLMETIYEEAYTNGFASGSEQGLKQYDGIIQQANKITKSISEAYFERLKQSEVDIVKLALTCAEKVLKQKLAEQPKDFLEIVRAALNEMKQQNTVCIYVHPSKYSLVKQSQMGLQESLESDVNLTLLLDYQLEADDCVVEYDNGQVLAGVNAELNVLKKLLLAMIAEEEK